MRSSISSCAPAPRKVEITKALVVRVILNQRPEPAPSPRLRGEDTPCTSGDARRLQKRRIRPASGRLPPVDPSHELRHFIGGERGTEQEALHLRHETFVAHEIELLACLDAFDDETQIEI